MDRLAYGNGSSGKVVSSLRCDISRPFLRSFWHCSFHGLLGFFWAGFWLHFSTTSLVALFLLAWADIRIGHSVGDLTVILPYTTSFCLSLILASFINVIIS
jgi:hypothetical protein